MCIYDCMWNPTVRLLINRFLSYLILSYLILSDTDSNSPAGPSGTHTVSCTWYGLLKNIFVFLFIYIVSILHCTTTVKISLILKIDFFINVFIYFCHCYFK